MWYYIMNNKQAGPVEDSKVLNLVSNGTINQNTKVWRKGMKDWRSAAETDLVKYFRSVQSPAANENKICPTCGYELAPKVIFCGNCGSRVNVKSVPSPKQPQQSAAINVGIQTNQTNVVVTSTKSIIVSIILTFIFGPLGMLYSTVTGGIVMLIISIIIGIITLGIGLIITWPICIIWGAIAANNYNKNLVLQYK